MQTLTVITGAGRKTKTTDTLHETIQAHLVTSKRTTIGVYDASGRQLAVIMDGEVLHTS